MTATPPVDHLLAFETPFGRPARWADVAVVTDIGDSHDLNDDRCLVLTNTDLGAHANGSSDFMLCLLADGATGSTFGPRASAAYAGKSPRQAGWRASQLAQAAFVECFLSSAEVDILDRLKDGLAAADRALTGSTEGTLSTTLVALYLAADGTACAASIGDSVLLVLPPRRRAPGDRRLKKLGYEDSTSVGSGDTTLASIEESECIEQWWPHKEGDTPSTRVEPGTYLVLMTDGISDNLPAEVIDQLLHHNPLDRATVALPHYTRDRRIETQKRTGGSTQHLGLDNMSAIVVRFDGRRRVSRPASIAQLDEASLVTVVGTHGGPAPDAGGQFGITCLAGRGTRAAAVPSFLRRFLESEHRGNVGDRLTAAFATATLGSHESGGPPFALLAVDDGGKSHTLSSGGLSLGPDGDLRVRIVTRAVCAARETPLQRLIRSPRIWGPALAALAVLGLVSTAFATGTMRPAPPPAPTARPGEPRPTPDTRPSLSLGDFLLLPPVQPTPVPAPPAAGEAQDPQVVSDQTQATQTDESDPQGAYDQTQAAPTDEPVQSEPGCVRLLGIGCQPPARPRGPARRAPAPPSQVVPVPSPAALGDAAMDDLQAASAAPTPGSRLATALRGASVADQNFSREVDPGSR